MDVDRELAILATKLPDASPEWGVAMRAQVDRLLDTRIVLVRQGQE